MRGDGKGLEKALGTLVGGLVPLASITGTDVLDDLGVKARPEEGAMEG